MNVPTQDCGLDLACRTASSAMDGITDEVARGAADLLVSATTWWVRTDSVDPLDPAVTSAQGSLRGVVVLVMVASVLVQAIRLIVSRKGEPLIMVAAGLVRYAVVSALGLVLLQSALRAGDAVAVDVLHDATDRFAHLMQDILTARPLDGRFAVLLLSVATAILALVQWILMALRQAGILVLAAMLPLAASGSLTRATRGWLDRLLVWLIAMVAYKPAAAFVYAVGFSYMSAPSTSSGGTPTAITGLMVLLLAVIAMPLLLKFFAWSGTQIGGGTGGSAFFGALGAVAMAQGGGRAAVDHAAAMDANGPGSQSTSGSSAVGASTTSGGAATAADTSGSVAAGGTAAASGAAAAAVPFMAATAAAQQASQTVDRAGQAMTGDDGGASS